MSENTMNTRESLKKLSDPSYHRELGIFTQWRVGDSVGNGQNAMYPYYDADQCREILDNVCGVDGWSSEYREVKGHLFAVIGIWVDDKIIEKSDAGGPRKPRKNMVAPEDLETWRAKTAASSAFVRTAAAWGIGRHHDLLPKIILKMNGNNPVTPEGVELIGPEQLTAYGNATSTSTGYLYWIYQIEKAKFESNSRAKQTLTELKDFLNGK